MAQYLTEEYCAANRTKPATRGYKIVCPACRGNDLWYTIDTSTAYCWECGVSYVIGDRPIARQKDYRTFDIDGIRQLYTEATQFYTSSMTESCRKYLHKRDIHDNIIELFKLGYCPPANLPIYNNSLSRDAGLCWADGTPHLSDRLVFPYVTNGTVTDIRGRCLGDEEPRYKSPYNQAHQRGAIYPFNYTRAIQRARETKILIITEGEIKAILADVHGFACVALPGMTSWRQGLVIESDITPVVIFDNMAGQEDKQRIDRAIDKLYRHIPNLRIGVLQLFGQEKMDIDVYLEHEKGGPANFKRVVDGSLDYARYKSLRRF